MDKTSYPNVGWGKEIPTGKNEHPGKVICGTGIEDIKARCFGGVPLRYHTDNDIKKRKIGIIQGKFALLTKTRNRLLPKLMSGEVEA